LNYYPTKDAVLLEEEFWGHIKKSIQVSDVFWIAMSICMVTLFVFVVFKTAGLFWQLYH
jgi:hypothetical protein